MTCTWVGEKQQLDSFGMETGYPRSGIETFYRHFMDMFLFIYLFKFNWTRLGSVSSPLGNVQLQIQCLFASKLGKNPQI